MHRLDWSWALSLALLAVASIGCRPAAVARSGSASGSSIAAPRLSGKAGATPPAWPVYSLSAEQTWQLNLPAGQRFDASGLTLLPDGGLLTVSDRGPTVYRLQFRDGSDEVDLDPLPNAFTEAQLARFRRQKIDRYDAEGLAVDELGRVYLCEEANRWVLRWDPRRDVVERLEIDWTPVRLFFSTTDRNASWEGIAVAGDKLYLANERRFGRIVVVDLATLKVIDHFAPRSQGSNSQDTHYSDLCWFDGALYVLLRTSQCVLRVDPGTKRVLAEYRYAAVEKAPGAAYRTLYPHGFMEGLAVDATHVWLVTDNNGFGRVADRADRRPTLFRCRRPDA